MFRSRYTLHSWMQAKDWGHRGCICKEQVEDYNSAHCASWMGELKLGLEIARIKGRWRIKGVGHCLEQQFRLGQKDHT